jgi:hypothetical protein
MDYDPWDTVRHTMITTLADRHGRPERIAAYRHCGRMIAHDSTLKSVCGPTGKYIVAISLLDNVFRALISLTMSTSREMSCATMSLVSR